MKTMSSRGWRLLRIMVVAMAVSLMSPMLGSAATPAYPGTMTVSGSGACSGIATAGGVVPVTVSFSVLDPAGTYDAGHAFTTIRTDIVLDSGSSNQVVSSADAVGIGGSSSVSTNYVLSAAQAAELTANGVVNVPMSIVASFNPTNLFSQSGEGVLTITGCMQVVTTVPPTVVATVMPTVTATVTPTATAAQDEIPTVTPEPTETVIATTVVDDPTPSETPVAEATETPIVVPPTEGTETPVVPPTEGTETPAEPTAPTTAQVKTPTTATTGTTKTPVVASALPKTGDGVSESNSGTTLMLATVTGIIAVGAVASWRLRKN